MYALYFIVLYLSIDIAVSTTDQHHTTTKEDQEFEEWNRNRFKVDGITISGEECMDNCNVTCTYRTTWSGVERKACTVRSNSTAPVYFTTRRLNYGSRVCLGKCGKFGWDYEWCLNSAVIANNWDYCNSKTYEGKQHAHLTVTGKICTTSCQVVPGYENYVCKNGWDEYENCDHDKTVEYVPARTVYGGTCVSRCQKKTLPGDYPKNYWYECYDISKNLQYCAPPAHEFGSRTRAIYNELHFFHNSYEDTGILNYEIPYE